MQPPFLYQLIGYLASVIIAVSLMNTNVLRLRVYNSVGAALFTLYGILIQAWPVAALNFFIVLVNAVHLLRMHRTKEYFELLEIDAGSDYLRHFIAHHLTDIRRYNPDFDYRPADPQLTLFVLRNTVPAGLFIARLEHGGDLRVHIDYVTPDYRDLKVGRFLLHDQLDYFRRRGVRRIISPAGSSRHARYLRQMGFLPAASATADDALFVRLVA
jgi:GNAT superfamily N-acetyltransferase